MPRGYPENPKKDKVINLSNLNMTDNNYIYLAGITSKNCNLVTGSRCIAVCKSGQDIEELYEEVEKIIEKISGDLFYRKDLKNENTISGYESAGVNIDEGNKVEKIINLVESTHDNNVESVRGDFGGLYNMGNLLSQYSEPIYGKFYRWCGN